MIKIVNFVAKFGDNTAFTALVIANDTFFCDELEYDDEDESCGGFKMLISKSTEIPRGEMENIEV